MFFAITLCDFRGNLNFAGAAESAASLTARVSGFSMLHRHCDLSQESASAPPGMITQGQDAAGREGRTCNHRAPGRVAMPGTTRRVVAPIRARP